MYRVAAWDDEDKQLYVGVTWDREERAVETALFWLKRNPTHIVMLTEDGDYEPSEES